MSRRDAGRRAPFQIDVAGRAERDRAGLEVQLGRGVDQSLDIAELLGADECDEIDGIDQAQLRRHVA